MINLVWWLIVVLYFLAALFISHILIRAVRYSTDKEILTLIIVISSYVWPVQLLVLFIFWFIGFVIKLLCKIDDLAKLVAEKLIKD